MLYATRMMTDFLLKNTIKSAHLLHIYTNDYEPDKWSVLEHFTEPLCESYAPRELWDAWKVKDGYAVAKEQPFELEDCEAYGYFVTDVKGIVLWAERFPKTYPFYDSIERYRVDVTPRLEFD